MQWPVSCYNYTNGAGPLLALHHAEQFPFLAHTRHVSWTSTISQVLHGFQACEDGLDHLPQMYASHYSLQSKCNLGCFSHPSTSSAVLCLP